MSRISITSIWDEVDINDPEAVGAAYAKTGSMPMELWERAWHKLFGREHDFVRKCEQKLVISILARNNGADCGTIEHFTINATQP